MNGKKEATEYGLRIQIDNSKEWNDKAVFGSAFPLLLSMQEKLEDLKSASVG